MEYKISELVRLTGVPKSTILYYIKEGLLPEAKKIKSNVHRYSDEHLELIKYIKYMQHEMQASIEQIRHILGKRDQSFSSSAAMLAPLMEMLGGLDHNDTFYTAEELLSMTSIERPLLERLIEEKILLPVEENRFTDKELSVVKVIERFRSVDVDFSILKQYASHAYALAELEKEVIKSLCDKRSEKNFSTLWQITFEMLFNVKPYLFNRHTYDVFKKKLKEEIRLSHQQDGNDLSKIKT